MSTRAIIQLIQVLTARHFRIALSELRSGKRLPAIVQARHVAMFIARSLTGASYPELGRRFGGQDHSTVIWAVKRMRNRLRQDPQLREAWLLLQDAVAVKITPPDPVSAGMRLTAYQDPPRLLVEIAGRPPVIVGAVLELRMIGEGRVDPLFGPEKVENIGRGNLWLRMEADQRGLLDDLRTPTWQSFRQETGANTFRLGRIMLAEAEAPIGERVVAVLGTDRLDTLHALVHFDAVDLEAELETVLRPFAGRLNSPEARSGMVDAARDVLAAHEPIRPRVVDTSTPSDRETGVMRFSITGMDSPKADA